MTKQQKTAELAKFIQNQSLLLLEKQRLISMLRPTFVKLHDDAEHLSLSSRLDARIGN